jgi:hypothetical protein
MVQKMFVGKHWRKYLINPGKKTKIIISPVLRRARTVRHLHRSVQFNSQTLQDMKNPLLLLRFPSFNNTALKHQQHQHRHGPADHHSRGRGSRLRRGRRLLGHLPLQVLRVGIWTLGLLLQGRLLLSSLLHLRRRLVTCEMCRE